MYTLNPGACGGNGTIYKYKTIDSRVANTAPTRNQISDTDFYKFKDSSDLEVFYTAVMKELSQTKSDILKKNIEFSGADNTDMT
ncbi:TPA: hypothetical protein DCZ39_00630 [Patescibacteria group bacterium]|nr:hypothetical protein [Candidatus Gracilibacteria bacterium]